MDIKLKIGKRIKELRNACGFSQEELADRAGIDRTYVNSVENGKRNVSIVNVEKITNALGCTLQEFFTAENFTNKKR
jgi:transcriptional regulator with XRE-family HTH domain